VGVSVYGSGKPAKVREILVFKKVGEFCEIGSKVGEFFFEAL